MTPQLFALPFLPEPGVIETFDTGHTLVFVPKRGRVFNVNTWIRTGSIHEDADNNGVSHFLEHLLFKGSSRCAAGEFDRAMESMGAVINAATWKDYTYYHITGPDNDLGEFDTALTLHADMLLHSTLPEAEIGPPYDHTDPDATDDKRERAVVIEEIGMYDDMPWIRLYNNVNDLMYPEGHPYRRDVIGTRQIVATIAREAIVAYYRRWYTAERMTTVVVGDFDYDTLREKVRRAFDFDTLTPPETNTSLYSEPPDPAQFAGVANMDGPRRDQIEGDYETNFFSLGFHGSSVGDLKAQVALDVAAFVLAGTCSSRLTQRLIEQADVPNFNTLECEHSSFKLGGVFFIQGNFLSEDVEDSLAQVRAELQRFLTSEPLTEDEFGRAVKKLKVQFAEHMETASGLAELIGEALTVCGNLTSVTDYLSTLDSLTREEVLTTARQFLDPDQAYTSVLVSTEE